MKFISTANDGNTWADQRECPDCGARITNGHLQHDDTCPVLLAAGRQTDTDREHGPHVRTASYSEREHLRLMGYSRAITRAVRVHVDGDARLFTYRGQIIAGVRNLGGAA